MAVFESYIPFEIGQNRLDFYVENYDSERFDDGGADTRDAFHVFSTIGTSLSHYGTDFALNSGGFVSSGTVDTLVEWYWDPLGESWVFLFGFSGFSTPIEDFFDVAHTASNADDISLIKSILSGNDTISLSNFDDVMSGYTGSDKMLGESGNDTLSGGRGNDSLYGGGGMDSVAGGAGNDRVIGGAGRDTLRGGSGDDIIRGGRGRDREFGGTGEDVFVFETGDDRSFIQDFDAVGALHDVIDLSGLASIKGWNDLVNNHLESDRNDVRIEAGAGDIIVLRDVSVSDLDKGDFLF